MKKVFAVIAMLSVAAGIAAAQQIGVIDGQRASQSYWKLQSEQQNLATEQQKLQDLQQQVKGSIEQLSKEIDTDKLDVDNQALSQERRDAAQKDIDAKTQQISQYQTSFQAQVQRFQRRSQDMQAEIEDDVMASVKKVAKANNLDLVLLSQVAPYSKIDITDMVIEDLNSTQPKAAEEVAPAAEAK